MIRDYVNHPNTNVQIIEIIRICLLLIVLHHSKLSIIYTYKRRRRRIEEFQPKIYLKAKYI